MASSSRSRKFQRNQKVEVVESGWGYNNWIPATYIHTNSTPGSGLMQHLVTNDHDPAREYFIATNLVRAVLPETGNNIEFNVGDDVEVFRSNMWMEAVVTAKNGEKYDLNVKKGNINLAGIDKASIRPKAVWIKGEKKYFKPFEDVTPGLDNNLELN